MINLKDLHFQQLDLEGVRTLVNWAGAEGWNPGPLDAEVYWATDPEGFYGYYVEQELIAGGSIISYNKEFGFMGLFIVRPDLRTNGIGRKLWYQRRDTLLKRLKKGAPIGMDGVVDMQQFYEKGGFKIAFRDERYEKTGANFPVDEHISPVQDADLGSILDYDKRCFGFSRPQFMKPWIKLPGNKTFKYVEQGQLKGFAIVRKARHGYKICPLFADDGNIAEKLYRACLDAVAGEDIYLDIPLINSDALALIRKYEGKYVFECARMYYGSPPDMDMNKVFGMTTFELG